MHASSYRPLNSWKKLVLFIAAISAAAARPVASADPPPIPQPPVNATAEYEVARVSPQGRPILSVNQLEVEVRLAGVAAPLTPDALHCVSTFLNDLLVGERVRIELAVQLEESGDSPPEARLFRMPDGLFVNLEVVRQGRALAAGPPHGRVESDAEKAERELLRYYQDVAQRHGKGIWSKPPAVAANNAASQDPGMMKVKNNDAGSKDVAADGVTVYVTESGRKYHRKGCQHLRKSSRAITLREAIEQGYEPCKRCKPPAPERDDEPDQ